ncbi:MAG: DUF896 domain-containing protein [Lachnospiraceae bacterium]|jgi:uncharacterized protein YnzC (UPF0291/DUF896 family)
MITEKEIQKINEYARRIKTGEKLSAEEMADRDALRQKFIQSFRDNLGAQLDSIKIKRPDGSVENLKDHKKTQS